MTNAEGLALTIGDLRQVIPMAFPDPTVEERFRSMLRSGDDEAVSVRITAPDESDVEGHAYTATPKSVWINVGLGDEDDTEGHAISVHFPTAQEADLFRKRLMAAGLLTGAVVLGSVGAIAVSNLPAPSDVVAPARSAVYERPAGHGFLEGVDATGAAAAGAAAAAAQGIDEARARPARSGFVEGTEAGAPAAAAGAAAAAASGIDAATGKPSRSGFLESADASGAASASAATTEIGQPQGGFMEGTDAGAAGSAVTDKSDRNR